MYLKHNILFIDIYFDMLLMKAEINLVVSEGISSNRCLQNIFLHKYLGVKHEKSSEYKCQCFSIRLIPGGFSYGMLYKSN